MTPHWHRHDSFGNVSALITVRRGVRDFVAFTRLARHSTVVESRVSWPRHPAGDSRRGHAESPW